MNTIHDILEIIKDLVEILVLTLTARQLVKQKKSKSPRRKSKYISCPAKGSPRKGYCFSKNSISHPTKNMNKKISFLLVALVVLDIMDGDFKTLSILDGVKVALYIICFALLVWNRREGKA